MKKAVKRRAYRSEKRQRQAEETRSGGVAAARHLFARAGYQATTIDAIAGEAGVSVQTVYAVFGSKRGVMLAIADDMDARADNAGLHQALTVVTDPHEQLRLFVGFQLDFYGRNGDVLQIFRDAGRADESLAEFWRIGRGRHEEAYAQLAKGWAQRKVLKAGVSEKEAADVLAALSWIDLYWYLVGHSGWSPERFGAWTRETLAALLIRPAT